ncbi:hypothetical protein GCM10010532_022630 [Dactylosporangium siamense]|uniref:Uncharacterized protein n=1 Tax=Dactylosporangium siamense TaxID=685454 RepID=A0A919PHS5_9ACTN|nr:hypothetical protein Dsi01nite_015020 [Dactylosporangium siamense]
MREFRAELDEPRDGALVKGRWNLAGAPERPRRKRSWMLATAGAAVAVAVVVGGAATLQRSGPQQKAPIANPPAAPQTSPADLPVTRGTKAPVNPAVTGTAGASHAQAVQTLTRLAAKQADGPLTIGADQVLYVKTYTLDDGESRYIHEAWVDVTTGVALRIRRNDAGPRRIDDSLSQAEIDQATATSASNPSDLHNLNAAFVAAFPTDPARAGALAESWLAATRRDYPGRNADALVFRDLHEVFHYVDPLLTAAQRRVLYLAIAELPSVKATTATIAGKKYDLVCASNQAQGTNCAVFDPENGRYVGDVGTESDMVLRPGGAVFVDLGVQPRPAPGPGRAPAVKEKHPSGSATTPKR